jgi:ABC-2 type transport system permease protein
MTTQRERVPAWGIIGAIMRKDLLDAVKNRMLLSLILGVCITILTSQALPLLLSLRDEQTVYLYDEAGTLADMLTDSEAFVFHPVPSAAIAREVAGEGVAGELGLVVPAGLAAADEPVTLDGYTVYWVDNAARAELSESLARELREYAGVEVSIEVSSVYPQWDGVGQHFMASLVFVVVVILMGVFLTPYLLLEEKESHTLEALMVSPASSAQIITGKALAGIVYCLIAAGIVLLVNLRLVTDWAAVLGAAFAGAVLFVTIGLLLGNLFDSMTNLNIAASGVMLVLLIPVMLTSLPGREWPAVVEAILYWAPTSVLGRMIRMALSGTVVNAGMWAELGTLLLWTVPIFALLVRRIQHLDR